MVSRQRRLRLPDGDSGSVSTFEASGEKLLALLLQAHPELKAEAEELGMKLITDVDPESVAEEVVWAFQGFDQEQIWDRSGGDQLGYTEPIEAAGEICEERFEPLMAGLERLIAMGQMDAALAQVKGLLLGLYRLEAKLPPEAEDFPSKAGAYRVLEAWAKHVPEELDQSMADWFQFEAPGDWSSDLAIIWRGLLVRFRRPR